MPFCTGSKFAQNHSVCKGFWDDQHFWFPIKLKIVGEIWEIWHFSETIYQSSLISKWSKISLKLLYPLQFSRQTTISISTKIQDGRQNSVNSTFLTGTISKVSSIQRVQTLLEITLSLRVFEINDILNFHQNLRWQPKSRSQDKCAFAFYTEIQDGPQKWQESDFCEKPPVDR